MVGFTKKKINTQTIGERLKRWREEKGISLDEIARATKIRKIYLEMVEADRFDELPPDVYVRGFLKGYACYLELNPQDVLRLYQKERGIRKNIKKTELPVEMKKSLRLPKLVITPGIFALFFAVFFLLIGVFYFYREIGRFATDPLLVVRQPKEDLSVEGNTVQVAGLTDKENEVFINGQAIFVDEEGNFNERIGLQQGINELEIKAVNHFNQATTRQIKVSARQEEQLMTEEEQEQRGEKENFQERLVLEVAVENSPTWVSVEIDGEQTQSGTWLPGSIQIFQAEEKISITSGKANQTKVKLNGEDLGVLDDSAGTIRDVIFTKDTKIISKTEVGEDSGF